MDIENLHAFCLPFSLCHDATSSSITDDSYVDGKQTKQDEERSAMKSNGSPMDDSSNRLDGSNTPQRSLVNEDHFIESSLSGSSHDAFDLLDLDMEMRAEGEFDLRDIGSDDICNKSDDWFSISASHDCSLFSPVDNITSASALHHRSSLKSHLKGPSAYSNISAHGHHHNHHQVFQHIVDPIDIKSSPTLAQLNLNSNDDPSDGLWDTTSATTTTSTSSTLISSSAHHHHHHHHHHLNSSSSSSSDLLSSAPNCNSSTGATSVATGCSGGNFLSTCSHLNNYNQHHGIAPAEAASHHAAHLNSLHLHHSCQHHPYHHHHHHQQQALNDPQLNPSHAHSTCLAVTPFRKSATQLHRGNPTLSVHQGCCLNHPHHQHLDRFNAGSPNISGQSSVTCPLDHKTNPYRVQVPHQHQRTTNCGDSSIIKQQLLNNVLDKNHSQLQRSQQQRCQSPAPLVTSSSSPLSSAAAHNQVGENRVVGDNKLKENIEYLTVLLCNGSKKLDNKMSQQPPQERQQQQQQPTISSSMVKSYSTLAQSLSTGPKLLERYQQNDQSQQLHQQHQATSLAVTSAQQNATTNQANMTTEMTPQCAMQIDSHMGNLNGSRRICPNNCFKPANVESSISAADSTGENQLPHSMDQSMNTCYVGQNVAPVPSSVDPSQTQVSRSSDMKVLSSLLNSNKCIGQSPADHGAPLTNKDNYNQQQAHCVSWPAPCSHNVAQPIQQISNVNNNNRPYSESFTNGHNGVYNHHDNSSIPINGRPITLTPLVSNNVSIPQRQPLASQQQQQQQQQQQINSKSKTPTFIQPASPSTSSTTSSSGNTEIAPPSSAFTKRQKSNANSITGKNNNQSERSGRPSSMSTDCSLSSHDEGFSSQIDQDDCGNSVRDSDDDSDIDSDDESFYGDYTNNDLIGASISDNPECKWTLNMGRTRRNGQRRFFWQYNVQSKGPKGTRICTADGAEDPFVLPEASDPVFSNECQVEGVKHSGKARRGDGNDLTPNPRKLLMIGLELKKLSKIINELAPVTDLPINARNKTRKEKNKLASRACRLKKKAQHEANKIKLYGLQREHQQVVEAIFDARKMINKALTQQTSMSCQADNQLSTNLKRLLDQCLMTVAGQTGDYVNSVLEKVVSGCIDGGLQT